MTRPRAAISWSGGKDSCAAYHRARDTDSGCVAEDLVLDE